MKKHIIPVKIVASLSPKKKSEIVLLWMMVLFLSEKLTKGRLKMDLFLSVIFNLGIVVLLVFIIALSLTKLLNPTATIKEIFGHWKNTWQS